MYNALQNFDSNKKLFIQGLNELQNAAEGADLSEAFGGGDAGSAAADEWITALNEMALATHMSVDEMNSYLNSMGVKANVTTTHVPVKTSVPVYRTEERIISNDIDPDSGVGLIVKETSTSIVDHKEVTEDMEVAQINTGSDAEAPTVHRAGGAGSSRTSGGGGGGGGGGGKSNKKEAKDPTKEKDRYHVIREKIADAGNAYDKLSKAQDRAFGK
jgi:hypothetical protein